MLVHLRGFAAALLRTSEAREARGIAVVDLGVFVVVHALLLAPATTVRGARTRPSIPAPVHGPMSARHATLARFVCIALHSEGLSLGTGEYVLSHAVP